jgi:hypothetical protein
MDLQVGGVSQLAVSKTGALQFGTVQANFDQYVSEIATGVLGVSLFGFNQNHVSLGYNGGGSGVSGVTVSSAAVYAWSSGSTNSETTRTLALFQDAAGILAQRNGTAKQVHRVYNTFLGTTANEWGGFDWLTTTNTLRIGTEHGGTGTARPIDFVTGGVRRGGFHGTNGNFDVAVNLIVSQNIYAGVGSAAAPSYTFGTRADTGLFSETATEIGISIGGTRHLRLQTGICVINSGNIGVGGGFDANLSRIAGSSLAIGNGTLGDFSGSLKLRNVIQSPGVGTIVTPASNGDLVFETTSNTSVTVKLKGTDGTVRSVALILV